MKSYETTQKEFLKSEDVSFVANTDLEFYLRIPKSALPEIDPNSEYIATKHDSNYWYCITETTDDFVTKGLDIRDAEKNASKGIFTRFFAKIKANEVQFCKALNAFRLLKKSCEEKQKLEGQEYSFQLNETMVEVNREVLIKKFLEVAKRETNSFVEDEVHSKDNIIYLLMDPRTSDMEKRQLDFDTWVQFVGSIFYVGEGKKGRPIQHIYNASLVDSDDAETAAKKLQVILSIQEDGETVRCLKAFKNLTKWRI